MNSKILNNVFRVVAFLLIAGCAASANLEGGVAQTQGRSTPAANQGTKPEANQLPLMVRNGLPGTMHERLNVLVGEWQVEMTFYIAGGTRERPLISRDLTCRRDWISETGNRHLRDITEGLIGGNRYYRLGLLGYSTMDQAYEWVTVDALNANMMIYRGRGGARSRDISMPGEFTDQGVLGDRYAGQRVGMRTLIRIESPERHVFELYMTPPKGRELLAARAIYTRQK